MRSANILAPELYTRSAMRLYIGAGDLTRVNSKAKRVFGVNLFLLGSDKCRPHLSTYITRNTLTLPLPSHTLGEDQSFEWQGFGFKMHFPENSLPTNVHMFSSQYTNPATSSNQMVWISTTTGTSKHMAVVMCTKCQRTR